MAKRKKCSPKCPIYDRCIFLGVGRKTGVCPLSKFSKGFRKRFIAIMMGNEYEMRNAILMALVDLSAHIMMKKYGDPKEEIEEKRKLLYDMIKVRKVLGGEKMKKEAFTLRRPPNAAANTIKSVNNLFKSYEPFAEADLHFSFQLNGYPHLGTIFSLTSLFAVAELISKMGKRPYIWIEVLENAPAKVFSINGKKYAINFSHYKEQGRKVMDDYFISYSFLFELLSLFADINEGQMKIIWYKDLQKFPEFREKLIYILENYSIFAKIFSPYDLKLKIRIPCPTCGIISKDSQAVVIKKERNQTYRIISHCPYHGSHEALLSIYNNDYVDVNTIIRNVIKESIFIEWAHKNNRINIMIDGADWMYMVPLIEKGLGLFGHTISELPIRIYVPMIVDKTGAKLSKSIHMKEGYPEFSNFINEIGRNPWLYQEELKNLYTFIQKLLKDAFMFYRNFSADIIEFIMKGGEVKW